MKCQKRGLVIVVLALFLVLTSLPSALAVTGCYVYPQAREDLYCIANTPDTEAQADCDNNPGCSLSQHFIPNSNCQAIPECQQVTCTADCQTHAAGKCTQLGGEAVPADQYDLWCSPGCCKISDLFCQFNLNRYQCEQRTRQLGADPALMTFANPVGMTLQQCNQNYCQAEVQTARLNGIVSDGTHPIEGATLIIEGRELQMLSAGNGFYEFRDLVPGSVLVRVQKSGYTPVTRTISLAPGDILNSNFTLAAVGETIRISGRVTSNTQGLQGATISWTGPVSGQTATDGSGNYIIAALPAGQYLIAARRPGYSGQEQAILAGTEDITLNLALAPLTLSGIRGITFIDMDGNGQSSPAEARYGVRFYVDGIFRGYSQYPDGNYQIDLPAGTYQVEAGYENYVATESIIIGTALETENLLLTQYVGECTPPNPLKDVTSFAAGPAAGQLQVRLQWQKPCPEVIGYTIEKKKGDMVVETIPVSPAQNSLSDFNVEWGRTYTYAIRAMYGTGMSTNAAQAAITLGNEDCRGRYQETGGWETFCRVGNAATRKTVWTCNSQNEVVPALNCADRDTGGQDYYCAQLSAGNAECKDAGRCRISGDPFGLYYSRERCYGSSQAENAPNYCYYDYTDTVVNQCQSCAVIDSCFDYRSQDACEINNCLDKSCKWVPGAANSEPLIDYGRINLPASVTPETGQGYCVDDNYDDDDQCSLCSPGANLFENYYCTANVCSNLGRCFSSYQLSACNSCGDIPTAESNCYTYSTEAECTAGKAIQKSPYGDLTLSADRCDWGRCRWQGAVNGFGAGACVKDADANQQDDCAIFTSGGEIQACRIDNSPPRTKIVPAGVPVVSLAYPNVTFEGDDGYHQQGSQRNKMGVLGYCLTSADPAAPAACTDYREVPYPGTMPHEVLTVNILNALREQVDGKTYRLRFYSRDKYHNREAVQEAFIFADNVPPEFELQERSSTAADRTTLTAYAVGTSEAMGCSFLLKQILPLGGAQTQLAGREEPRKEVTFPDLPGIVYNLSVTCRDDQGNERTKQKLYTFDHEERITVIQPALSSAVASTSIQFKVETLAGARCELYRRSEKVADFISNEQGKQHQTAALPGFVEREYAGEYKAVCRELLTEEQYEDYFHFTVDFTPPETQILLREAGREERPAPFGWEKAFIRQAQADFECRAEGFACDRTFYCLGSGCESVANQNYREYTSSVAVANSTLICYYSTDEAANPVYAPTCGTILIEGYGLVLEKPLQHYYREESWGVSNLPTFDLQFFTKVPTQECRFDVVSGFPYNFVPAFKVLTPHAAGRYTFANFPEAAALSGYPEKGGVKTIYVACKDASGDIGPEQKITLEYDPSAPEITLARARPDPVIEGNTVDLLVDTDDKTICRYSDRGQGEYALMNFVFPGGEAELGGAAAKRVLSETHQGIYTINSFLGLTKEFNLTTQCRNGAGDLSPLKTIEFMVDYSQAGGILSFSPNNEFLRSNNVTLQVETTKNALCSYRVNGTSMVLAGAGGRVHTAARGGLAEGYYQYPFSCLMGEHSVEEAFTFTIDRDPPAITGINDGEYNCGQNLSFMIYTDEQNITHYIYELYDAGAAPETAAAANASYRAFSSFSYFNSNGTFLSSRGTKVAEGTLPAQFPLQIPASNLTAGHRYYARIRAQDAAGNMGQFSESDGVHIIAANNSLCAQDVAAPDIQLAGNETCTGQSVELHCADQTGCGQIWYGTHASAAQCAAVMPYSGAKITFNANGWLCYLAKDVKGNNVSGSRAITLADADGDGIADSCDRCAATAPGKITDDSGCASNQIPEGEREIDTDHDGLPDYWEKLFDTEECPLNYAAIDSDDNGVADAQEDYDLDTLNNYEEYTGQYNPCMADIARTQNKTALPPPPSGPGAPEESDILAGVLLILGLLLLFGGIGYLVYYYKYTARPKGKGVIESFFEPKAEISQPATTVSRWKEKLFRLRQAKSEKAKSRQREELFGKFGKESATIPHLTDVIKARPSLPKLQQLAEKYAEHKEEIKPGLRQEEKSIFAKLEGIATQTKEKKIHEVADAKDAQSIFEKLKEISKKRKEK